MGKKGFLALLSLCDQVTAGTGPRFGDLVLLPMTAHHSSANSRMEATKHKTAK